MNENPLRQKLLKLAEDLIDEVNGNEVVATPSGRKPLADRIDVLKAGTTLYLGDEKLSGKSEDEPPGRGMREWVREVKGTRADA